MDSCTPSLSKWLFWLCGVLVLPLCVCFTNSLIKFYFTMVVLTIIWIFIFLFISNCIFRLSVTKYFWFCKCAPPWMFTPLDFLFEYCIEHVTFSLLNVMVRFSARIFYRGVPGFATDCLCGVWCRGLIFYSLYVGPLFINLVWTTYA